MAKTAAARAGGFPLSPLATYLLGLAVFALFVTSPFTIGHVFAWVGILCSHGFDGISSVFGVLSTLYMQWGWPAAHPALSWLVTALIGFHLYLVAALCFLHDKAAFASWKRTWSIIALVVCIIALNQLLFWVLPDTNAFSAALTAAGGVPEWLTTVVGMVSVLLASGPIGAVLLTGVAAICVFLFALVNGDLFY
jgi:hypothetical protein